MARLISSVARVSDFLDPVDPSMATLQPGYQYVPGPNQYVGGTTYDYITTGGGIQSTTYPGSGGIVVVGGSLVGNSLNRAVTQNLVIPQSAPSLTSAALSPASTTLSTGSLNVIATGTLTLGTSSGSGSVTLSGGSTYSGGIIINGGTIGGGQIVFGTGPLLTIYPEVTSNDFTANGTPGTSGFTASGSGNINDVVNLPAGGSITYMVHADVWAGATGKFIASANIQAPDDAIDSDLSDNFAEEVDTLTPQADLAVSMTDNSADLTPDTPLDVHVVITNSGPSTVFGSSIHFDFGNATIPVTYTAAANNGALYEFRSIVSGRLFIHVH